MTRMRFVIMKLHHPRCAWTKEIHFLLDFKEYGLVGQVLELAFTTNYCNKENYRILRNVRVEKYDILIKVLFWHLQQVFEEESNMQESLI